MTFLSKFSREMGSRRRHVFILALSAISPLAAYILPGWTLAHGGKETLTITWHLVAAKGESEGGRCRNSDSSTGKGLRPGSSNDKRQIGRDVSSLKTKSSKAVT